MCAFPHGVKLLPVRGGSLLIRLWPFLRRTISPFAPAGEVPLATLLPPAARGLPLSRLQKSAQDSGAECGASPAWIPATVSAQIVVIAVVLNQNHNDSASF